MPPRRHHDSRVSVLDYLDAILVRCPQCSARSDLRRSMDPHRYRFACTACGRTREWLPHAKEGFRYPGPGPVLYFFELEVWLQTPCCGNVLWAYNAAHVDELTRFVGAELRGRDRHPAWGWSNQSMASRLPRWIQSGHHRPDVLKGLDRLRRQLDASS